MSQTKKIPQSDLMFTSNQLAEQLCISKTLLYDLKAQGKLPVPIKLGRRILWPRREIEKWIMAGCPSTQKWQNLRKKYNFSHN